MDNTLEIKNLKKTYGKKNVLDGVGLKLEKGKILGLMGPNGSGKTTLLKCIMGLIKPNDGEILIDGKNLVGLSDRDLTEYRRNDVGFVFQHYNLIPNLTALENVEMASEISDNPLEAEKILEEVGLGHRLNNFPSQLSGGEQQRVAIARALAKNPKLLLCDEPTGALDYETGKNILRLLQDASRKMGATVVIITHNSLIKPMADQVIEIRDGRVDKDYINENPVSVDEIEW